MLYPETGQRMVVHGFASRQPLQRRLPLAASSYFPRRPDALAVSVNPQTDQQPGIVGGPPAFLFAALDALVEAVQIQAPDQFPNRPRRMIFADQLFHIHRPPNHMLTIDPAD